MSLHLTENRLGRLLAPSFLVMLLLAQGWVSAAEEPTYLFDIPQGSAIDELNAFYAVTNIQLLYNYQDLQSLAANAVKGSLTSKAALDQMFSGTNIVFSFPRATTVAVRLAAPIEQTVGAVVAQRVLPRPESRASDRRVVVEEVTITGRSGKSERSALDVLTTTIKRDDIDSSGFVTTRDPIRVLPLTFGGGPTEDTVLGPEARANVMHGEGINLRGIGAGSTLVLWNGKRLAGGGSEGAFVDIAMIPLSAIDKIEVLPDSSSTIYGSDAVGGVVNFVMRDSFDGRETQAHFGQSTRGGLNEVSMSQLLGAETNSGHGVLVFEYYSRGALSAASRVQAQSDLTLMGGGDYRATQSNPGNFTLRGASYAVPRGQDGTHLTAADFVKGAPNLQDQYKGGEILPDQSRFSLFGSWRQSVDDRLSLFGDVLVSHRKVLSRGAGAAAVFSVPTTNAFYVNPMPLEPPAALLMKYNFYDDLGPTHVIARALDLGSTAGFELQMTEKWRAFGSFTHFLESVGLDIHNVVNAQALSDALGRGDRATAFNPMGEGSHTNKDTLEQLRGFGHSTDSSSILSATMKANGPVAELSGGDVTLNLGVEGRKQTFTTHTVANTTLVPTDTGMTGTRHVWAAFGDMQFPIIGESNRMPGLEALTLGLAGRYENYSDFGNALTPRVGLMWSPLPGLKVRSTYSESFRPPGLLDLNEKDNAYLALDLRDPQSPSGTSSALFWLGKNRNLKQETSQSWTVGAEMESRESIDRSIALTYFSTNFRDRLTSPALSLNALADSASRALVTRNPSPEMLADVCRRAPQNSGSNPAACGSVPATVLVDARVRNDARAFTQGLDLIGKYRWERWADAFTATVAATYIFDFKERKSSALPAVERVNSPTYPVDFKARVGFRWQHGRFELGGAVNYMAGYPNALSTTAPRVHSWTTVDAKASYTLQDQWFGETTFSLGADNLFDRDPPFVDNALGGLGFDQENGDLKGRIVGAWIRKSW